MGENGQLIFFCVLGYLFGSIPFGKLAGNIMGVDIQKQGSGNIGFANVRRHLGWKAGIAVLAGDMLKGYAPVALAAVYLPAGGTILTAAFVLAGAVFPVWLGFKGGKGVAAIVGISFAFNLLMGAAAGLIYLAGTAYFRKSAPASLIAVWTLPVMAVFITLWHGLFYLAAALFITWAHRNNLRQMRRRFRWFR